MTASVINVAYGAKVSTAALGGDDVDAAFGERG